MSQKGTQLADAENDEEKNSLLRGTKMIELKSQTGIGFSREVLLYMFIFFSGMIVMEVAMEGVMNDFPNLGGLPASITLFQFGGCFFLPLIVSRGQVLETFPKSIQEFIPYIKLTLLVFGATALATASVQYVSYPTKVVFKSAKLIPTMIVASLMNKGVKYRSVDYFAAAFLCLGAAGFSYGAKSSSDDDNQSMIGILMLCAAVTCDALVPNLQGQLMNPKINKFVDAEKAPKELSASAVMVNVNAIGFCGVLVSMLFSGTLQNTISTSVSDPMLFVYLLVVGLGISNAVLAYTRLIKASSSVTAVTVSTVRKVATMILSYIIYPKPITKLHAISLVFVFTGVVLASFCKPKK